MRRFRRCRRTATLLLLLLAGACSRGPAPPDPGSLPLPEADTSGMDPILVRWLEEARRRVAETAAAEEADAASVAASFGDLGQLYQVFELYDAAQVCYENARLLLPDEFRWVYLLATVQIEKGEAQGARRTLEESLELDPGYTAAWIRLGDVLLDLNEPEAARESFERGLELGGESAGVRFGLGRVEVLLGRPEAAIEHLRKALELQPQASAIRYPLAQALRQLGETEAAEATLSRHGNRRVGIDDPIVEQLSDTKTLSAFQVLLSMAGDPGRVEPPQLLGFALTHLGRVHGTAARLLEVTRERESRSESQPAELARLHYVLAGLLVHEGRDAEAIEHFRRALVQDGELVDARIKLGNALARRGELEAAEEEFRRALEQDPQNRELRMKQVTVLLNRGRAQEAMRELESLIAEDPEDAVARIRLAELLEATGARARAEAAYDSALAAGLPVPAQARLLYARGAFHQRQGRLEVAMEDYREALQLDRSLHGARLDLAAILGHLGRYAEAASQYGQVSAARPSLERAWLGEAAALVLAGEIETARSRLEAARAELPASRSVALQLARLLAAAPEATVRDGRRALELAQEVFESAPSSSAAETLAMAYAELGRFDEAIRWQSRASDDTGPSVAAAKRLELYRSGRPYRAPEPGSLLVAPGR